VDYVKAEDWREGNIDLIWRCRFKDEEPLNTISRIRNILSGLDILTVEKWFNPVPGIYSVRVEIPGTGIGTNGKGVTHEYALASAYGEFMERMQNIFLTNYTSPEIQKHDGFLYYPDEKYLSMEEIIAGTAEEVSDGRIRAFVPPLPEDNFPENEFNKLANLFKSKSKSWFPEEDALDARYHALEGFKAEGQPPGFVMLPYYNVNEDRSYYLPLPVLRLSYGSNGMCAGNTPGEALVQGLCEVFERYVNVQIIKKKLSPPDIPREYIKKFPAIDKMLEGVKQGGRYKLIFKDCSLGKDFPVIGLWVINRAEQKYFIKFGAHPVPEIAMERCLTELLQGRDIRLNNQDLPAFRYLGREAMQPANLLNILKNGHGYYPPEIFSSHSSYQFKGYIDYSGLTNRDMLNGLVNLIARQGYQIFIRDVSFLGFPAYHVVVPGFSELRDTDRGLIQHINRSRSATVLLRNMAGAAESDLLAIVDYLQNNIHYGPPMNNLGQLLNVPVSGPPWLKMDKYLFIGMALIKMKRYQEALAALNRFNRLDPQAAADPDNNYYKCVGHYLEALVQGVKEEEIPSMLDMFYPANMVRQVVDEITHPEQIFKDCAGINCWNCQECDFNTGCPYETVKNLMIKLKDRYADNIIDQDSMRELFQPVFDSRE